MNHLTNCIISSHSFLGLLGFFFNSQFYESHAYDTFWRKCTMPRLTRSGFAWSVQEASPHRVLHNLQSKSFVHISRAVTHCSMFMHISRGVTDDTCHKWTCAVFMWRFNQIIPLWTLHSDPYFSMFMHISSHFMLCLFIQCSSAQGAYWTYLQLYLCPTSFLQRSLHRYRTLCRIILLLSMLIVLQCTLNSAIILYLFDWT